MFVHSYNMGPYWSWAKLALGFIKARAKPNNLTKEKTIMFVIATSKHNLVSLRCSDYSISGRACFSQQQLSLGRNKESDLKLFCSSETVSVLSCIAELWVCLKSGHVCFTKGLSHSLKADVRLERLLGKRKLLLKTSSRILQWLQKAVSIKWYS